MPAPIVQIATDLAALISSASITPAPAVKRLYVPKWQSVDAEALTVFVVTSGQTSEPSTRIMDSCTYTLQVAVWSPVTADGGTAIEAQVDSLLDTVQQVFDAIRTARKLGTAQLLSVSNLSPYRPDAIADNVFASVIEVKYQLLR